MPRHRVKIALSGLAQLGAAALLALGASVHAVDLATAQDPDSGLTTTTVRDTSLTLSVAETTPAAVAELLARFGLPTGATSAFATSCVVAVSAENTRPYGSEPVLLDLRRWRVIAGESRPRPVAKPGDWLDRWQALKLTRAARTGLRWALMPPFALLASGDRVGGLVALDAEPGSRVDLRVEWRYGQESQSVSVGDLQCAAGTAEEQ
ncbi:MAG: hypothetical protein KDG50_09060 [Chromatiales bacterium]|nr:hypothetical protein [Chromatiales bacterium]